jgi:putative (di)nucleoside polyphosphate hydrolase
MVDKDGYRPNIGVVVCNRYSQVLWARRCGHDAWQFPQGGIKARESVEQALYRELWEEVGLSASDVQIIGRTRKWLRYEIPLRYLRSSRNRTFRGQKQIWFLLKLVGTEESVRLDRGPKPEFEEWRWVEYWTPVEQIIDFKRDVYRRALTELAPLLPVPPNRVASLGG